MEAKGRIRSFDAFRGLVILLVVTIGHYWQFTPAEYYADGTNAFTRELTNVISQCSFRYTYSMMEFLFLLSGFQMYKYYDIIREGNIGFLGYMKKRMKRLYPLYLITTVIMTAGLIVYQKIAQEDWYSRRAEGYLVMKNLLCVQSWNSDASSINGPLWFVSVLVFCVILFYVLSRLSLKVKDGIWLMGIPVAVGILFSTAGSPWPFLNQLMCRGYLGFFLGVILASFAHKISRKSANIYACAAITLFTLYMIFGRSMIYDSTVLLSRSLPALFLLYIPLVLLVIHNPLLDKIIGNRVFCGLGKISYSLYTINFPFYIWVEIFNKTGNWKLPYGKTHMYWVMAGVQIVLAVLIYNFIEKPLYKKLEKI